LVCFAELSSNFIYPTKNKKSKFYDKINTIELFLLGILR